VPDVATRRSQVPQTRGQWDFQLNLNLRAVCTGAQAAGKIMKDHGGGTIINVSSGAGRKPSPFNGPYGVAKAGVNSLTQTLAAEMAQFGIRVNGVSPGPIPTEVFMEFFGITEEDIPSLGERFKIPLRRVGTPEDIATAAIYCASPASSWMTGNTIEINGGL
jgi:NAD(P)-dependent dehydrogenase (short-subunit alcohol dehydrogenase family)